MEQVKLKKINEIFIYFFIFIYLELLFKILMHYPLISLSTINITIFNIFLALFCHFLTSLFKDPVNRICFHTINAIICLFYGVQVVVHNIFGFYFDFSLLGATDQIMSFTGDMISLIFKNILYLLIIFLPFILSLLFSKYIKITHISLKKNIFLLLGSFCLYGLFLLSLFIGKDKENSPYKLFYKIHNVEISLENLGVVNTMILDLNRYIWGFDAEIVIMSPEIMDENNDENDEEIIHYDYNKLDIDFDSLIAKATGTIKNMHEYFKNEEGTLQNEYTGFFKNKNLIMFMAESFNEIAVDKDRTPTLYKLINNGFVFNNFYTPTISSTIGGEFQEITGLVAASGFLSPWKSGENSFPYGIGKMFKQNGFKTYAYHDHTYTFQNRYKYLKALGFDNFLGCRNGLEKRINCNLWPESDVEMIDKTFDDYINSSEPFMVYYVTVSGHGGYSWSGNAMSVKHRSEVENLEISEAGKAYLAAQIELDKALELLLEKLDESNKLDDTVIALVGDHYPYFLSNDEVNEIASYKKDPVVEINHSNFILWNNKMDKIEIDKVGSQIDVLPTIYNIFGLPYDSRLIIGNDILSPTPGLAIFGNQSWVSDYGTYFAAQGKFEVKENKELADDYVEKMNQIVRNRVNMSKLIMTQNYYKYIK